MTDGELGEVQAALEELAAMVPKGARSPRVRGLHERAMAILKEKRG